MYKFWQKSTMNTSTDKILNLIPQLILILQRRSL